MLGHLAQCRGRRRALVRRADRDDRPQQRSGGCRGGFGNIVDQDAADLQIGQRLVHPDQAGLHEQCRRGQLHVQRILRVQQLGAPFEKWGIHLTAGRARLSEDSPRVTAGQGCAAGPSGSEMDSPLMDSRDPGTTAPTRRLPNQGPLMGGYGLGLGRFVFAVMTSAFIAVG